MNGWLWVEKPLIPKINIVNWTINLYTVLYICVSIACLLNVVREKITADLFSILYTNEMIRNIEQQNCLIHIPSNKISLLRRNLEQSEAMFQANVFHSSLWLPDFHLKTFSNLNLDKVLFCEIIIQLILLKSKLWKGHESKFIIWYPFFRNY